MGEGLYKLLSPDLFSISIMLTKEQLTALADRYETPAFLEKDPSKFMHRFLSEAGTNAADAELTAFIAANLAFGRREQILSHVEMILGFMKKDGMKPVEWLLSGSYKKYFTDSCASFYRMYKYADMRIFFDSVKSFLKKEGSLGAFFKKEWERKIQEGCVPFYEAADGDVSLKKGGVIFLHSVIASSFEKPCALISKSENGCAKKLNMFLRWMVRDNSPVDLGLWTWYDKKNLLMPLDTHVMHQAAEAGFIKKSASGKIPQANLKTCLALTCKMKEFFPSDPVRSDFALFGLGVNQGK